MITKQHAIEICRDLGYSLNSNDLQYYQNAVLDDFADITIAGYTYVGFASISMVGDYSTSMNVFLTLKGVNVCGFAVGDLVWDTAINDFKGRLASSPVKFAVFDGSDNPYHLSMSFYGYRFRQAA